MEPVSKRKLCNLVQFLFNDHVSEEHKKLLLLKYDNEISLEDAVSKLVIDVYRSYYKDEVKLNYYLNFLCDEFLDGISLDELKETILRKLESNFECGNLSLDENHEEVRKALLFICRRLNEEKIDYYVVGSVPIYIKLNIPFSRFHSDVDIAVSHKDIDKLGEIFKDSDYEYMDNRLFSQKFFDYDEKRARGGHEIVAQKKDNEFSIGIFEFERLDDGSIIKKDYFSEIVDGNLINRVCKYHYGKKFTNLYYSKDYLHYEDVKFKYCTIEGTYLLKKKNASHIGRNKDSYDVQIIENNYALDQNVINKLQLLMAEAANYEIDEIN